MDWTNPISAGIGGVAQLGGAALGGKAAKQAAKTQMQSQDRSLAFAREQDAARRQDWAKAMAAYEANRNALLSRYGLSVPAAQPAQQAAPVGAPVNNAGSLRDLLMRQA